MDERDITECFKSIQSDPSAFASSWQDGFDQVWSSTGFELIIAEILYLYLGLESLPCSKIAC